MKHPSISRRNLCLAAACLGLHGHSVHAQPSASGGTWTCLSVEPPPDTSEGMTPLSAIQGAGRDPSKFQTYVTENGITPFGVASVPHAWRRDEGREPNSGRITLGVHFMNGSGEQKASVIRNFPKWLDSRREPPPIFFLWDQPIGNSDIRVLFGEEGNKSYIGREARQFRNQPTLWLQDWRADHIVMHECGHALGAQHEHLHPGIKIEWNEQKVLEHYRQYKWSDDYTRRNVMLRLDESFACGPYDSKSVMIYEIPAGFATNFTARAGTQISDGDFKCLSFLYQAGR